MENSDMNYEKFRNLSFDSFMCKSFLNVIQLAASGLFYKCEVKDGKNYEFVQCNFCNIKIEIWEAINKLDEEHEKGLPKCPLLCGKRTKNKPVILKNKPKLELERRILYSIVSKEIEKVQISNDNHELTGNKTLDLKNTSKYALQIESFHSKLFKLKDALTSVVNHESFVPKPFNENLIENGKYGRKQFIEKKEIGGDVIAVTKNNDGIEIYAIKRIKSINNGKEFIKVKKSSTLFSEMNHVNILKYFDNWLENDFTLENGIKTYTKTMTFYMQMELCDNSLKVVIDELKNDSFFNSNEALNYFGYYIASEIFIEILEGVNYLHKQTPPIIHKNLHPWNILLKIDKQINRFIKIADWDLANINGYVDESYARDSKYIYNSAPEVQIGQNYDEKVDIYSLGIILQELFLIDLNRDVEVPIINNKYEVVKFLHLKMLSDKPYNRPDCRELLQLKYLWALNVDEFNFYEELEKVLNSKESDESFVFKLLKKKLFLETSSEMNNEKFRIESFKFWPNSWIDVTELAANGFFYKKEHEFDNVHDEVECNFCNIILCKWVAGDLPQVAHERFSPNCPFFKGETTKNFPLSNLRKIDKVNVEV